MKVKTRLWGFASVGLCLLLLTAQRAQAQAAITSGPVTLGVDSKGQLDAFGGTVGLIYAGIGDALSPGCACEGWGVAGNGISGYVNNWWNPVGTNLTVDAFGSTATTATSSVHLTSLPDLKVTQAYAPAATTATGALFDDTVTVTNTSGATITGILYRRVMDWDVPPSVFTEAITVAGAPATNVIYRSDQGFASADPQGPRNQSGGVGPFDIGGCGTGANATFTDCSPFSDHGSLFDMSFGNLAAGATLKFHIYYGASRTEAEALAMLGGVGAEVISLGQDECDTAGLGTRAPGCGGGATVPTATFMWGFSGVGGTPVTPVPEPASMVLLGSGLALIARKYRRR